MALTLEERTHIIDQLVKREMLKLARIRTLCAIAFVAFWLIRLLFH